VEEYKDVYQTTLKLTKEQEDAASSGLQSFCHADGRSPDVQREEDIARRTWIEITPPCHTAEEFVADPRLLHYSLVSVAIFGRHTRGLGRENRSNYIRPITAIQQTIAPTWQPLLQTPPFPEYPADIALFPCLPHGADRSFRQ